MEYLYEIYLLSSSFINDYPLSKYPELMYKNGRPYNCLIIESHDDYFICVPYRTSIRHNNAFLFKNSIRSIRSRSGLDYSKIVIIKDPSYLSSSKAIIDKDEYRETMNNMNIISSEAANYVTDYINHVKGTAPLHIREYERRYKYSTLPYFHDQLNI